MQNVDVHCLVISLVCLRLFPQIKPCAAKLMHDWVDHCNSDGKVDRWSKSAKLPAFFQQTCGMEQSSLDSEW